MQEKGGLASLDTTVVEYCLEEINQNTVQNKAVGELHSLATALIGLGELKTLKCIYRKKIILFCHPQNTHIHTVLITELCLSLAEHQRHSGEFFKRHLRGCHAAQCFQFNFACHTKVQVLRSLTRPLLHMKNSNS